MSRKMRKRNKRHTRRNRRKLKIKQYNRHKILMETDRPERPRYFPGEIVREANDNE